MLITPASSRRPSASNSIWRLEVGGNKHLGLIPHDLNYFHTHFIGRPLPTDWSPPPIAINGKSKKLPDFMSWMAKAPVVSERARLVLDPIFNGHVQFFPFHDIKGKKFYALNVIQVETTLLDAEKSDIFYSSTEPKIALSLKRAFFREPLPSLLPPIFKVSLESSNVFADIFVTRKFADIAIEHQLTGIALANPQQDGLKFVLAKKSQNVVPGIIE